MNGHGGSQVHALKTQMMTFAVFAGDQLPGTESAGSLSEQVKRISFSIIRWVRLEGLGQVNSEYNDNFEASSLSRNCEVGASVANSKHGRARIDAGWLLSGIGVLAFLVSLALPAIKHGQDLLGINCFTLSLFCIFGSTSSPLATERQLMSIASHAMHVSAFISLVMIWTQRRDLTALKCVCAMVTVPCLLFVMTVPYSSIERVYVPFYLWLGSMASITVAQFLTAVELNGE